MEKSETDENRLVSILNHYRHDWLNDLQLIFGYVKLKKYDNLEIYLDKIKDKLEEESAISRLNIPALMLDIIAFRQRNYTFGLKIEVERGLQFADHSEAVLSIREIIMSTLQIFQEAACPSHEKSNDLYINMSAEMNNFTMTFDYNGNYLLEKFEILLERMLEQLELMNRVEWISHLDPMDAYIKITLPIQT